MKKKHRKADFNMPDIEIGVGSLKEQTLSWIQLIEFVRVTQSNIR